MSDARALRMVGTPGERMESGPVQFGEDWPGVFIRGDDAFMFAHAIRFVLAPPTAEAADSEREIFRRVVQGLVEVLESCDVRKLNVPEPYEPTRYRCANCDGLNVSARLEIDRFPYGSGDNPVELQALVRVFSCADCHDQWTAHDGSEAREAAVREYLASTGGVPPS